MKDYSALNEYRVNLVNKETGKHSYCITWCYGNISQFINETVTNLKSLCLLNVSSETHEVTKIIHLFDNSTIYERKAN